MLKKVFLKFFGGDARTSTNSTLADQIPQETDPLEPLRLLAQQGAWIRLEEKGRELLLDDPLQEEVLSLVAYSLQQQE
jgi:hypothetical protein